MNHVQHLVDTFNSATDTQLVSGLTWYQEAHRFALTLCTRYGITPQAAAGIIAALSPQNHWDKNLVDAELFCAHLFNGESYPTGRSITKDTYSKLRAISEFRNGNTQAIADIVRGKDARKVHAFYWNILKPSDETHVTIDRHATDCYYNGKTQYSKTGKTKFSITTREWREIHAAYIAAADICSVCPCQFQAVVWVVWRDANSTYVLPAAYDTPNLGF